MQQKKPQLFIILDANSIMHRSYHALPPLTTRSGEMVNAVFGFSSILLTILTQEKPAYIAAAFDTAAPTFRHDMYTEYKAGRTKAPDDFYAQIPRIEEIVRTMNIPILCQDGVEADDIIGTIVKTNERKHPELMNKIVTSDMDAMQLVTEKTCVSSLHKGYQASECFWRDDVFKKYSIYPEQVVDYKAIQGDNSDNIPGVKGIGKVGAIGLLKEFGTLDGIYAQLEQIKGKKKEYLATQKKEAYFSQTLATIKCDVNIDYELEACKAHDFDSEKVIALFDSLQFYSLIRRLKEWHEGGNSGLSTAEISKIFPQVSKPKKQISNDHQSSLF
jgi:DNA polymerase-1